MRLGDWQLQHDRLWVQGVRFFKRGAHCRTQTEIVVKPAFGFGLATFLNCFGDLCVSLCLGIVGIECRWTL